MPPPADPAFRLLGTEPFWSLSIDSTGFRFTTPEDTAGRRFPASRAVMAGDSLRWNTLADDGTDVEVVVAPADCSDGMSDRKWTWRARVQLGSRTWQGCAERRTP